MDTINIFFVYAQVDEQLRKALENHLSALKRQEGITSWYDQKVLPGQEWEQEAERHLRTAHIILLLVSPEFLASDYVYGVEFKRAMERHQRDEATVIPIIVRPVDWKLDALRKLRALPANGKPVTSWSDPDEGFLSVAKGIREVSEALRKTSRSSLAKEKGQDLREQPLEKAPSEELADQDEQGIQQSPQALALEDVAKGIRKVTTTFLAQKNQASKTSILHSFLPPVLKGNLWWIMLFVVVVIVVGWRMSTLPVPVSPTQTLDAFCAAMKVHNQIGPNLAAAGLQFTDQGWKQFQLPGQKEKGISIVQMTRS